MRIEPSVVREVLARTDLAALIGAYVPLTKRGNDLVGLCPFHAEKTPSFHVHPDRGFFKCFGCGAGGDAIRFLGRIDNVPFPEAVRTLAKRAGIALEEETPGAARARSEKEQIYAANALAADYFHAMLLRDPAGEAARAYCERRGLGAETIAAFKLGFAPDRWDGLVRELQRSGVDLGIAARAGLVKMGQHGHYDFYRGRLMIPTASTTGEIVAFGGRALGDEEPKYLNTSTTPVYVKGRSLFALGIARKHAPAEGAFIVVEGYLDCIALHQAGFRNAVASLGTAFTAEQADELKKYCANVYLCFDPDAAGRSATAKHGPVLDAALAGMHSDVLAGGEPLRVRVVDLPPGEDPDSFVRGHGREAFAELLRAARPLLEHRIDAEIEKIRAGFHGAGEIAEQGERLVRSQQRAEWDRWRVYIAHRLGLQLEDLRRARFLAAVPAPPGAPAAVPGTPHVARVAPRPVGGRSLEALSFEREVLQIALAEPKLVADFAAAIPPERFPNPVLRRLYAEIVREAERLAESADVVALFAHDDEAVALLAAVQRPDRSGAVRFPDGESRRRHLERVAERLRADDDRERMRELDRRIDELLLAGEPVPGPLRDEFSALVAKLKR